MKKYFLTIYIPTYNRAEKLMHQLSNISMEKLPSDVRVVVSDNCSTQPEYETEIRKFCESNQIEYRRHAANMGGNINILDCFRDEFTDTSEYIWCLSDDDILKEGAVGKLISLLKKIQPQILLMSPDFTGEPQLVDEDSALKLLNAGLGLISAAIYKGAFVLESYARGYDVYYDSFPHANVAFDAFYKEVDEAGSVKVLWVNAKKAVQQNTEEGQRPTKRFITFDKPETFGNSYILSKVGGVTLAELLPEKEAKVFVKDSWKNKLNLLTMILVRKYFPLQYACSVSVYKKYIPLFSIRFLFWKLVSPMAKAFAANEKLAFSPLVNRLRGN